MPAALLFSGIELTPLVLLGLLALLALLEVLRELGALGRSIDDEK